MGLFAEFKAALFDLDGVILDTMGAHAEAWREAGTALNLEIDEHEIYLREGEKGEISARDFIKANGLMLTKARVRTLLETKEKLFTSLARRPKIFPQAVELLAACKKQGWPLALVTGTSRSEMEKIVPPEIAGMFDAAVCGDEVRHGKPNPEPYMAAASLIKLQPRDCLAVENAPYGIQSAKTAGCRVVAVRSYLTDEDLKEAHQLVDDLAELMSLL